MNTISKNVFDVSPFLLMEASADSEAVHDLVVDDDDISESCSASSYETSCVTWRSQRPSGSGFEEEEEEDTKVKEERDALEEEVEDDGEGEVNSYRVCGRSQRENLAVEMSEMDKSRMFWEACLTS